MNLVVECRYPSSPSRQRQDIFNVVWNIFKSYTNIPKGIASLNRRRAICIVMPASQ